MTAEEVLALMRALSRPESHPALEAALAWGLPKCRTEEERLLYPALLLVLGNLNALVTHRRLEPGDLVDFHLTASRPGEGPTPLRTHLLLRVPTDTPPASPSEGELWLTAEDVRSRPLECAARALVGLLGQIAIAEA